MTDADRLPLADPLPLPAAARLLGLRLQGFKSFAERTTVEFGGGISAVVGPNGSGKSNLADALRWALGEQGRALRSRKAEDVIWAGSEKRAAQGMADVTLVLDNADGLLPVDYQVLELGRRLYRSGENEYLLNKQRIRLRDLVDLLDGAHLADNAFLFIGQGMVDQALALRPEERRPLFEEVAGVRRHERRRRKAEAQLLESSTNLARVEDILAELRPQARRLAAQAEQQADRTSVGDELVAAILSATHARWYEAARRLTDAAARRARARAEADRAMHELEGAESAASALAQDLSVRAAAERDQREAHDAARAALTALQLRDGRLASELEAAGRDAQRLDQERTAAEAEIARARRALAIPVPGRDLELEAAVAEADRELADALTELGTMRSASQARGEELAALRRAETARQAGIELARRRLAESERRLGEEGAALASIRDRHATLVQRHLVVTAALADAHAAERAAATERERARADLETAEAERAAAADRAAMASTAVAALRGRLDVLVERLSEDERRPIAKAARAVGGRRVDEDLVVDPGLRAAVEAVLADRVRAYVVPIDGVPRLAGERGTLVIQERISEELEAREAATRRLIERVEAAGGGRLLDAVQRDAGGGARRLLARAVWLPDLAECLAVQAVLPGGWVAVPRDGSAVVDDAGIALGAPDPSLERRAEHGRLAADLARAEADHGASEAAARSAADAATAARGAVDTTRALEARTTAERRRAEDAERAIAREVEAVGRELAWTEAQVARVEAEVVRSREALPGEPERAPAGVVGRADTPAVEDGALATWQARAIELRDRRDRLVVRSGELDTDRRVAEQARSRAEGAVAQAEARIARAEVEAADLAARADGASAERGSLQAEIARVTTAERQTRDALTALHAADAADRARLTEAERAASGAREALRAADDRLRSADRTELEARLGMEGLREGVLVELAGLGDPGLAGLAAIGGAIVDPGVAQPGEIEDDPSAFESALDAAAIEWAATPPSDPPPAAAALARLRRRYHELGAANPFAVEEFAELKVRLDTLETQHADLQSAIGRTRELIAELDTMIADQFRTTFEALETAFERRFAQLFGGGFARLSLTDPSDLGATGIEIVARPPGKKAQALAMLSGGERALTAVALLFSMLEVRPVPFCVLDEVDAALDEANIGRFAEALRSLADQTQFIVITHNRGTIEAADALYGVTVGDDSVSRVISLRLDEARALASDPLPEPALAG